VPLAPQAAIAAGATMPNPPYLPLLLRTQALSGAHRPPSQRRLGARPNKYLAGTAKPVGSPPIDMPWLDARP